MARVDICDVCYMARMRRTDQPVMPGERPILPWRMAVGALLHFAVAGYLLVVPLLCLLLAPAPFSAEGLARLALRISLWFLLSLAGLMLVMVPAMLVADRWLRARRRRVAVAQQDPRAQEAAARVQQAARAPLGETATPWLSRIAGARWAFWDARYQALARDLAEVVQAATVALASSSADRRDVIDASAAHALARIANEVEALGDEQARADEAEVQRLSIYLQNRYPAYDSPLRPD